MAKVKEDKKAEKTSSYGAEQITILEGLAPVRKRPGMYIGTTGLDGLQHLITEIFDNARDEAMGGFANDIEVTLLPNNRVRVTDNGRGIPIDIHKQSKVSALETIMTTLHAGGKFGEDSSGYKVSGGLHGVGASVVNALSIYCKVTVHKDGGVYMQEYSQGKKKASVKKVGTTKQHGTIVVFEPDPAIFPEIAFDFQKVVDHLRQQAYLVKGLRITVNDARETQEKIKEDEVFKISELGLEIPSMSFYFEGGLLSLVKFYNSTQKPIHKNIFYVEKKTNEYESVEVALQYVDDISSRVLPFANNIYTAEGGTHVTGFKTALTRTLNTYGRKNNLIKESEDNFTGEDVLEGLTAVISVKLREIQFEGQTKSKLGSVEAQSSVNTVFSESFSYFLEENPDDARAIIMKVILALRARKAAKAAKDSILRKGALEGMTLPGKLADCQSGTTPEDAELFVVEGDSAGGTAKTGRDRRTQAILPLRGKILNIERARLDRMLESEQIKNLVIALGTAIGDTFDISKLRYHKVIIATDADVDGAHIRTLILTLLYRFFKPLIDGGFIYIAQPPLYKIKKGKEIHYAYSDDEKMAVVGDLPADIADETQNDAEVEVESEIEKEQAEGKLTLGEATTVKKSKISIQRYKGLGEMNAEELWETTMDPARRILKQVTIADAVLADKVFDILMGSDVPSRKSFIQSNATKATLDI
ncbi:MAG: DNA topoisomerase IV subunit B [Candidatus Zambryskibacteria bacterium RIFCSPLOWO2_12_FULL_39_45]|uniref:DNA topoisomerase (ATP-hydrolyzing) n=2 Tax=Candidatus Zambryskiibacteriota TaxID=1817925 RepID=A0A1G2T673_9BACT|nr:MAG: gyrase subunit B protein [Parcubacteria group bacterium GW2011_GWA2_40_14]OHA92760.1 MAG: DNA topoisomerase IV subunit B [Candidatus Zambryskibacteria bacterium RIFCSPHIGHO2_02_38_10.5]OHA95600.1 MAG: DNA topoisomerase IV subunit B [Candidatus Zambryskibacteria bacterium RIFCSPHIGHO2_02_FULL_39_82]OHA99507.1 MAG: DNA topoisomerase IV subunit B [Candidatus Zambryskibacteria bacterium RIFCSPHIGHO2_12_FULL_38_37]OHB08566.1 MAG: DNA topoisomerase IV subunit B [Candidatus Zambryskibacteria b